VGVQTLTKGRQAPAVLLDAAVLLAPAVLLAALFVFFFFPIIDITPEKALILFLIIKIVEECFQNYN
jgi:hypothetical protein